MAESIYKKTWIFIIFLLSSNLYCDEIPEFLTKLQDTYEGSFTIVDSNTIKWNDGEIQVLDDGIKKSNVEMIQNGDIEDQFSMKYPKGEQKTPPESESNDPGRVRNNKFFTKLYGNTPDKIEADLKELHWLPSHTDIKIMFNTKYGAYDSLKRVSDQLEKLDPKLLKYVTSTAGTFNWRFIKDTNRLSTHSFGIAIDINVEHSSYWKWDKEYKYRNKIPYEIVKIFEENGFIWGGKWYHYDTMHFEYRPELL